MYKDKVPASPGCRGAMIGVIVGVILFVAIILPFLFTLLNGGR